MTSWSHHQSRDPPHGALPEQGISPPPPQPPSAHPGQEVIPHSEDLLSNSSLRQGIPQARMRPPPSYDLPLQRQLGQRIFPRQDATSYHCIPIQHPKDPPQLLRQDGTQSLDPLFQKHPGPAASPHRMLEVSPLQHSSERIPVRIYPTAAGLPSASHGTSKALPDSTELPSLRTADPSHSPRPGAAECPQLGRLRRESHRHHPGTGCPLAGQDEARLPHTAPGRGIPVQAG